MFVVYQKLFKALYAQNIISEHLFVCFYSIKHLPMMMMSSKSGLTSSIH